MAKELREPYAQVAYRRQSLLYYRTIFSKSAFPHLLSQLHPLVSPFTAFWPTQSRFMRLSIYILQVNLVSGLCFGYFLGVYRESSGASSADRDVHLVDQTDILVIFVATGVAALLLTPWLSEPLIKASANKLEASARPSTESMI